MPCLAQSTAAGMSSVGGNVGGHNQTHQTQTGAMLAGQHGSTTNRTSTPYSNINNSSNNNNNINNNASSHNNGIGHAVNNTNNNVHAMHLNTYQPSEASTVIAPITNSHASVITGTNTNTNTHHISSTNFTSERLSSTMNNLNLNLNLDSAPDVNRDRDRDADDILMQMFKSNGKSISFGIHHDLHTYSRATTSDSSLVDPYSRSNLGTAQSSYADRDSGNPFPRGSTSASNRSRPSSVFAKNKNNNNNNNLNSSSILGDLNEEDIRLDQVLAMDHGKYFQKANTGAISGPATTTTTTNANAKGFNSTTTSFASTINVNNSGNNNSNNISQNNHSLNTTDASIAGSLASTISELNNNNSNNNNNNNNNNNSTPHFNYDFLFEDEQALSLQNDQLQPALKMPLPSQDVQPLVVWFDKCWNMCYLRGDATEQELMKEKLCVLLLSELFRQVAVDLSLRGKLIVKVWVALKDLQRKRQSERLNKCIAVVDKQYAIKVQQIQDMYAEELKKIKVCIYVCINAIHVKQTIQQSIHSFIHPCLHAIIDVLIDLIC
jgi:hypothetical protein